MAGLEPAIYDELLPARGVRIFLGKPIMDCRVKPGNDNFALLRSACNRQLLARYKNREVGGGRATRQPGQVRKEAALTSTDRVARQPPTDDLRAAFLAPSP